PWLADDKDAQVEPCGDHDIFSDFPHQLRFAEEFVNYYWPAFAFRHCATGARHSPGQNLDAMRGQLSGVLKFAHNRAVHRLKEFHDKMGLPTLNANCEFTDSSNHCNGCRRFEFALQPPALDPDTVQMDTFVCRDLPQIL